jgi:hypothetical protein
MPCTPDNTASLHHYQTRRFSKGNNAFRRAAMADYLIKHVRRKMNRAEAQVAKRV